MTRGTPSETKYGSDKPRMGPRGAVANKTLMNRTRNRSEQIVSNLRETMATPAVGKAGDVACKGLGTSTAKRCWWKDELAGTNMRTHRDLMVLKESSTKPKRPKAEMPSQGTALFTGLLATLKPNLVPWTRFLAQADAHQPIFDKIARLNDNLPPSIVLA